MPTTLGVGIVTDNLPLWSLYKYTLRTPPPKRYSNHSGSYVSHFLRLSVAGRAMTLNPTWTMKPERERVRERERERERKRKASLIITLRAIFCMGC